MINDMNVKGTAYPIGGDIADGQWVSSSVNVFDDVSFSSTGIKTYTVSNYLPDNDHVYEVMVGCYAYTGTTSGDTSNWWVTTEDEEFNQVMGYCQTRSSSNVQSGNSGILPVQQHNGVLTLKINVTGVGGGTGGNSLTLAGYRRLRDVEANEYTLTINPTPADATVTFNKGTVVGNTCTVTEGTTVTYTVSKSGYATTSASVRMNENKTVNVTLQEGIQMYGYTYTSGGNSRNLYMMGGQTSDNYMAVSGDASSSTVTEITGTIGASGSKVKAGSTTYTYEKNITINGLTLCCYTYTVLGVKNNTGVFTNAVVGSKYIYALGGFQKPTSANSSQVNWGGYIYNRNSTLDYVFTGE